MAHVYLITCIATGQTYIGGSTMPEGRRWSNHRSRLRAGRHKSPLMQAAYYAHGEASFVLTTLTTCAEADLLLFEQRAIDAFEPEFNAAPKAGPIVGLKRRPEQVEARRVAFASTTLAARNANPPRYEIEGQMLTSREISVRYGIPLNTVKGRLSHQGLRGKDVIR